MEYSLKRFLALTRTVYFRVGISVLIIFLMLVFLPFAEIWDAVRRVSIQIWIGLVSVFLMIHMIGVFKWRFIVGMGRIKIPYSVAFRCYFYGLFGNLFLPSVIGGDLIRAGMAVRHVAEKEQIIVGSIMDRFLDISSVLAIVVIGTILGTEHLTEQNRKILTVLFFVLLVSFLLLCTVFVFVPMTRVMPKKFHDIALQTRFIIVHLVKHPVYALGSFSLAVVMQSGFVLLNAFLGSVCGIKLSILVWFIVWPLAKISAMIPVSLGGVGIREVALAALFSPFGVQYATAVGYGFVWETVIISGSLIGFLLTLIPFRYTSSFKKDKKAFTNYTP